MSRTCNRCGEPAAKGGHYVTVKVGDSTTQMKLKACITCGNLLAGGVTKVVQDWLAKKKVLVNKNWNSFIPGQQTLVDGVDE